MGLVSSKKGQKRACVLSACHMCRGNRKGPSEGQAAHAPGRHLQSPGRGPPACRTVGDRCLPGSRPVCGVGRQMDEDRSFNQPVGQDSLRDFPAGPLDAALKSPVVVCRSSSFPSRHGCGTIPTAPPPPLLVHPLGSALPQIQRWVLSLGPPGEVSGLCLECPRGVCLP